MKIHDREFPTTIAMVIAGAVLVLLLAGCNTLSVADAAAAADVYCNVDLLERDELRTAIKEGICIVKDAAQ